LPRRGRIDELRRPVLPKIWIQQTFPAIGARLHSAIRQSNTLLHEVGCLIGAARSAKIVGSMGQQGSHVMSSRANHVGLVVVAICMLVGCQSGPRWAFWRHDTPENSSLVAKSTAPVLPSSQSVPQSVTATNAPATAPPSTNTIVGATPPSANSMAAALGTTPASIAIPQTPPAATAGMAALTPPPSPSAATAFPNVTPYGGTAATKSTPASPIAASTPSAMASPIATAGGPYDPNAYKPASATSAASSPSDPLASDGSSDADRYGMMTPPTNSSEPDRYTMVPDAPLTAGAPPNSNMSNDRYSASSMASPPAATTPVASAPVAAAPADAERYGSGPATTASAAQATNSIASPAAAAPSTAATVRIAAPAGQYRPGGTSTFTGLPASGVEIASRPATGPAAPATPAAIGASAIPSGSPGIDAGTKTY
jgi:hypothetical protein